MGSTLYYRALGLKKKDASQKEILERYLASKKQYPDWRKQLHRAFTVLYDPNLKLVYDREGERGLREKWCQEKINYLLSVNERTPTWKSHSSQHCYVEHVNSLVENKDPNEGEADAKYTTVSTKKDRDQHWSQQDLQFKGTRTHSKNEFDGILAYAFRKLLIHDSNSTCPEPAAPNFVTRKRKVCSVERVEPVMSSATAEKKNVDKVECSKPLPNAATEKKNTCTDDTHAGWIDCAEPEVKHVISWPSTFPSSSWKTTVA